MKQYFIILLFIFSSNTVLYGQYILSLEDVTVLEEPADTMMKGYLTSLVDKQFAVRDSLLSTLKSAADWDMRAQTIQDSIVAWTGALPERTPLNARVTGRLERDDYVIEKILFESRPDYYVSANLYLPKNNPVSRPALLNVIGHTDDGKADERYQRLSIAQAKNGFVVLTIDGLGQGERVGSTEDHQSTGVQAFISGTHLLNFMVWDAIRSIDYLVSRPEVDPEKISMTGSSGGGMLTTYLLPFEDRIAVSIPVTNPNTWSYRVHANLATDHEQVFFGAFANSIDPRGDPLFTHAPKPLLLNTTTDDNLNPPRGVWDLSTWLYKAYSAHGAPEKFSTTMVKAGHDYNREQRELTYAWMLRWMGNNSSDFWEEDTPIENAEDLWAASGGSIFNESGSTNTHDLVLDYLSENRPEWGEITTGEHLEDHKIKMKSLIDKVLHINLNDAYLDFVLEEEQSKGSINIRSFLLEPEAGIQLPGILLESNVKSSNQDIILYINEKGKSGIINDIEVVQELLTRGYRICAVDLRGTGETSPDMADRLWDFLAGEPIFAQRVGDILTVIKWLKESEVAAQNIRIWGTGMSALHAAFAGVLTENISGFVFEEPLLSFESVVQVNDPVYNYEVLLPGILKEFDMTQIYQALAPLPVSILNPVSGDMKPAETSDFRNIEEMVSTTYYSLNSSSAWSIQKSGSDERGKAILRSLLD